jgi:hypothetical protein
LAVWQAIRRSRVAFVRCASSRQPGWLGWFLPFVACGAAKLQQSAAGGKFFQAARLVSRTVVRCQQETQCRLTRHSRGGPTACHQAWATECGRPFSVAQAWRHTVGLPLSSNVRRHKLPVRHTYARSTRHWKQLNLERMCTYAISGSARILWHLSARSLPETIVPVSYLIQLSGP